MSIHVPGVKVTTAAQAKRDIEVRGIENHRIPVLPNSAQAGMGRAPGGLQLRTPASRMLVAIAILLGTVAALSALPPLLPALSGSLVGSEPKGYWYLSRASGLISYILLWLSMAAGIGITNRLAGVWPGLASTLDLHRYLSLLGLFFALFHALVLMGDGYINYDIAQLIVPFGSSGYRQAWVGLGQLALYMMAAVGLSFFVRRRIGVRWWRVIHSVSFAVFALALVHGLLSGTDSGSLWAAAMYWSSAGSVLFLAIYRMLSRSGPASVQRKGDN